VLKPEDLQFMEDVHNQPGADTADAAPAKTPADPKKQAQPAKPHDQTEVRPVGGAAATARPATPPAATAAPRAAAVVPPPAKPAEAPKVDPKSTFDKKTGPRYTATYQVASFPGKAQAETHVKDLAKKGVTASVREAKSGNNVVFRVTIQVKGSDAEISDSLKKSGEKGAILLGKKPL
jgi:cell division protein FtsN